MATATLLTGEDLLRMRKNGRRYELVRGELIEMSPPSVPHGKQASRISRLLDEFVDEMDLGTVAVESGFYVARNPDTVRGPDVMFFSKRRLDPDSEAEGYAEVAPELAVEVVSPDDTYAEVTAKVDEYLRAGVQIVWIVDPRFHRVTVYPGGDILSEGDALTGGEVLPGFSLPVSRIFQRRKG